MNRSDLRIGQRVICNNVQSVSRANGLSGVIVELNLYSARVQFDNDIMTDDDYCHSDIWFVRYSEMSPFIATTPDGKVICAECGELHKIDDCTQLRNGLYICNDCINVFYTLCEVCDDYERNENMTLTDAKGWVCKNCKENLFIICSDCGNLVLRSDLVFDTWNAHICSDCAIHYTNCVDCGKPVRIGENNAGPELARYSSDDVEHDRPRCHDCHDRYIREYDRAIHDYSYKPYCEFYALETEENNKLFYGVELEVDDVNDNARRSTSDSARKLLNAFSKEFYCKSDGSLECGYEIVTHPMTMEYHRTVFDWNDLVSHPLADGYRSHDAVTCGLHIHASRDGLGTTELEQDLTIAKILLIFDKFFDSKLKKFSRRSNSELQHWANKPNADISELDDNDELRRKVRRIRDYGRYKAVNLQNEKTIEFRLFRGTLNSNTLIASIELIDNIIKFAMSHDVSEVVTCEWSNILEVEYYDELNQYCNSLSMGLIVSDMTESHFDVEITRNDDDDYDNDDDDDSEW